MNRNTGAAVYVAGHNGMVGSAIVRRLTSLGYVNIVTASHSELDLVDQRAVRAFFAGNRIDQAYLAAARVGGIEANNSSPADFIYDNLLIEANIIKSAHDFGVPRLLFLGSSCIYPKFANQPMAEDALLTGALEATNEPYAIAKIAGIKLCESFNRQYGRDYRSVMPTNLYGPGDNYHASFSHVIPGLLRRFHDAREGGEDKVVIWGSGSPRREFLHVDDMAAASVHIMELDREVYQTSTTPMLSHVNVGTGSDCSISDLASAIAKVTRFTGRLTFDTSKPDGAPRKLMDVTRIQALGWKPTIDLEDGLEDAYAWFVSHQADLRGR
ncbi:GDP-L-fucose synthase [Cryobacterium sp. TMT2-18-3]|uniref:GDP-L-fucose synthase n=1 Tax=unclassified Cryobacterium TaxID=2649013 RepID=UPI0010693CA3|nr:MULTISPECIES: GDP-L-fucose synthase [unclassified Cryobacterium]TFC30326.1 GDP-L-fucose synthase [Cryobacterium sp. TMT2-18-2]TFC33073.1 GDP-L-fucose synthase [Cryobacterium sp. TMT2-42-4]TFC62418.1 GDP-L-fucose synthase [Cryobacterium sp. TMT2-15-1]TFC66785.1 GDP-L-fucose synthase [Cryobacterium sp. TMT2-18-3]